MLHEPFDIDRFKRMFPLPQLRQEAREFVLDRRQREPNAYRSEEEVLRHIQLMEPCGEIVTSPFHMAVVEQLRLEMAEENHGSDWIPTDVFVFATGEPVDRRCTKIGGLPFLPGSTTLVAEKLAALLASEYPTATTAGI